MAARIQREILLLVISLIAAVISLPAGVSIAAVAPRVNFLAPVTQGVKAPARIALDGSGASGFYVTDPRNGGVLKYSASGSFLRLIRTTGSPQGVAVMSNGNLVVTMGSYAAIIDPVTGLEIKRLSEAGVPKVFGFADGVAIDGSGSIFVADSRRSNLVKFNNVGDYVASYGTFGSNGDSLYNPINIGNMFTPSDVTYDSVNNRIAVTDSMLGNIKFFSVDGVPQSLIGLAGPYFGPGAFTSPMGVEFEYTSGASPALNRIYVVDSYQSSVQVLDATGAYLDYIGDYGPANGQLMVPTDAVFDKINKRLLVVNGYGNVTIYSIDGGRTPVQMPLPTSPSLVVNDPLSLVRSSSLQLTGTVTSGSKVSCALNGLTAFTASVTGTSWSCSVNGLSLGANTIEVVARNDSPVVANKQLPVTYALNGPGLSFNDPMAYVNVNPLPVTGKVDLGSTVQVCNPVTTCYAATVDASGVWSYSIPLTEGTNTITVKATNAGETVVAKSTVYDSVAPVLTLSAVPSGATLPRQLVNISGAASDLYLSKITVNGSPVTVSNGRFSYPIADGSTSVQVVAEDLAGNKATQVLSLYYNPAKVAVDFTSHADGAVVQTTPQTVTGVLSGTATTVTVNGEPVTVTNGTWSKSIALTQTASNKGVNTVLVDVDGAKSKLTLVYDPANPAVAVTVPSADKAVNAASVQIAGTVGNNVQLTSVVGGVESDRASNVPFDVSLSQEAVYPVVVKAKDLLTGNTSQVVRNIINDLTKPSVTVNSASGTVTRLTGTVEPGAKIAVKAFDATTVTATIAYTGTGSDWSADLITGLTAANLYAEATDAAGNVSTQATFRPDGDINSDGVVTDLDVNRCIEILVGKGAPVTPKELAHGDIGPLVGGLSSPNGRIDLSDCVLILRKASGLQVSW